MNKPYRIGIIGLGNMGTRYFDVLRQSARWQVVWVCNRNPERLRYVEEHAPGVRVSTSAQDLFDDPSLARRDRHLYTGRRTPAAAAAGAGGRQARDRRKTARRDARRGVADPGAD